MCYNPGLKGASNPVLLWPKWYKTLCRVTKCCVTMLYRSETISGEVDWVIKSIWQCIYVLTYRNKNTLKSYTAYTNTQSSIQSTVQS